MKLDHDLARSVLLKIEQSQDESGLHPVEQVQLAVDNKVTNEQLAYTIKMLNQAGFIDGKPLYDGAGKFYSFFPIQLTYDGHEYLDEVRSPKVWRESKSLAAKVGSVSLSIMGQIASTVITNTLYLK